MVTRDTAWPHGTPCWVDLSVDDPATANNFYAGLFGWKITVGPPETGGYAMCEIDGRPVAGIMPKPSPDMPSVWTTYLAVDDADEATNKIAAAGGSVFMGPMDVMDVGRMAVAADPAGAVFGIWQARAHTGAQVANEPGALCWNENMSRDFAGNKAFYQAVFGYEYGDMSSGEFSYATFKVGGKDVGGIGGLGADVPEQVPAHWTAYFAVADTDAALAKVTELGGKILRPAVDSPYGRMATVTDTEGGTFSVISVPTS